MGDSNHGSSSSQVTVVDDSDPSVQMGSKWKPTQPDSLAYNETLHTVCEKSPLTFNFIGTSIKVIGKIPQSSVFGQPNSTYLVDGAHMRAFQAPSIYIGSSPASLSQVVFYSQDGLSAGPHTLTINLENGQFFYGNKDGRSICMFVDYLEYTPVSGSTVGGHPVSGSKRSETGIIVGTVLAVVAILAACLCALIFWRRIRRTKHTITVLQSRVPDEKWDTRSSFSKRLSQEYFPPELPASTAVFSTVYAPSAEPLSPTDVATWRDTLDPQEPSAARRRGSPMRSYRSSSISRQLRPLKLGFSPPSTTPSSIVFAPPKANPFAKETRIPILRSPDSQTRVGDSDTLQDMEGTEAMEAGRRKRVESWYSEPPQRGGDSWYGGIVRSQKSSATGKRSFWAF